MKTGIKICGLTDAETLRVAASCGARWAGLVFFPPSPRALAPDQAASLVSAAPSLTLTGLYVDPDDELLARTSSLPLGLIQLHGSETPRRVAEIRARFGRPVMKALKIAGPEDLLSLSDYEQVADWILFDAKAPPSSALPGGNGAVFDWTLLKHVTPSRPWMLSGGLTPDNVGAALSVLQPDAVDVSSGVEDAPGRKSAAKIRDFIHAVRSA